MSGGVFVTRITYGDRHDVITDIELSEGLETVILIPTSNVHILALADRLRDIGYHYVRDGKMRLDGIEHAVVVGRKSLPAPDLAAGLEHTILGNLC